MSLRLRILIFITLFALIPLLMAAVINLPLVLDRVDMFYRHAFLQNLRADFADLDQHLASRDGSLSLLAKVPEPGVLIGNNENPMGDIEIARLRYLQWINLILAEQTDITQIMFTNEKGEVRYWLERDSQSGSLQRTHSPPDEIANEQLQKVLKDEIKEVISSPLRVQSDSADPKRFLSLQRLVAIRGSGDGSVTGAVVVTLDVGRLVNRDDHTLWVHNDGRYLKMPGKENQGSTAFDDFSGLRELFAQNTVGLWEDEGRRAIWVPMFVTASGEPLWVGRRVDSTPLKTFRSEVVFRVIVIVAGLVVVVLVAASTISKRVEKIGSELTGGIKQTLEKDAAVTFEWNDTPELRQLAFDLTQLSKTHAAQVRNLRAHTRELENTNRYKSEFLANVSHELRTPLNSILLLSKLLRNDEALQAEAKEKASVIHKASADLKALIDNILDLSRVEAGQMALHIESVSVQEVMSDMQMLMSPQFEAKHLQLQQRIAASAPQVIKTDSDKVRQVLKNFLGNALKFTAQGSVLLSATPAKPPYAIALAVKDSGIGIPREKQEIIFEAFKQADGSTSRRYGGTGLGLTISRQLASLLGGEIQLVSEPGQGATFTLLLPLDPENCMDEPAQCLPLSAQEEDTKQETTTIELDCHGCQILLLDTDIQNQLQMSELAKRWGAGISLAGDIEESIETLEELAHIDVVLFNLDMSGFDPCATITALKQHAESPVLFIGLSLADKEPEQCAEEGLDHVIKQPVLAGQLAAILDKHFINNQ